MSQKNETPVLILSLLITLGLIGGGLWWLASRFNLTGALPKVENPQSGSNGTQVPLPQRFSLGDRLLITDGASPQKQAGVQALASKNYSAAVSDLQASLQANRNDPEALIYLNNARIGDQKAYTIAVSVPAGSSVGSALEILRGAAQAQNDVNQAGGINGVPLKVMIASDDNSPDTCKQVAETLVKDSSVLGVVGHFGSDATLAAAPIYQQGGLVMISPTSTSVKISELGDYIFRTVPSDRFTATALSRYLVNSLKQQNAAIYYNAQSDYSKSLKDEFTTALYSDGGQIVSEFDLSSAGFNAQDSVKQAAQKGAKVLVLAANTATLDQALQVVTANQKQLAVLGGDSLYNPKVLQVGGAAATGMVVAVPWIFLSNPNSAFAQTARQLWGGDVNWRTATTYDSMQALIAGLKQNPTRQGVQQALSSSGFAADGATGTIRFLPSGDRNQAMQLVVVQPGNRSGYGFDFIPVRE